MSSAAPLPNSSFLSRVDALTTSIATAGRNTTDISIAFSRSINVLNATSTASFQNLVASTHALNTSNVSELKRLEADAASDPSNAMKTGQVRALKGKLTDQLESFKNEEWRQRKAYREQLARDYRIVHPGAIESEVFEASQADWTDESVFASALNSTRSNAASTALGNVRARHNDIQLVEARLIELNDLFVELAAAVEVQEFTIVDIEKATAKVQADTTEGNAQLEKGVRSARNARKLKWWALFISVLIACIIAAVVAGVVCTQTDACKSKQ